MKMNAETKRKLRDMGCEELIGAMEAQDETVCMGLTFEERVQMAVDEAHSSFVNVKVASMIKAAKLRYPDADVRQMDFSEERGIDRLLVTELAACGFAERCDNVVFQGYSGTGKTYAGCALAKECCRRRMRSFYVRIPDLEERRRAEIEKKGTDAGLIKKLGNYELLVLDEWLLEKPKADFRSFLMEVMERRFKEGSTIFCTQFKQSDWYSRLGGGVNAEAVMDRIVHNAIWVEMGEINMREKLCKSTS